MLNAADRDLPKKVRVALAHNADLLSPISVTWEASRSSTIPLPELLRKLGYPSSEELTFFTPITNVYSWQDGMSYMDQVFTMHLDPSGSKVTGVEMREREIACNGKKLFYGSFAERAKQKWNVSGVPRLSIDRVPTSTFYKTDSYIFSSEYLHESGFKLPVRYGELQEPAQSLLLFLVKTGAKVDAIEDATGKYRGCLMIKLSSGDRTHRFYLDPALGYAVRAREQSTAQGALELRTELSDFYQFKPGLWLPKRCELDHFTWTSIAKEHTAEPLIHEKFQVTALSPDRMPADRFTLRYTTPYTMVDDATLPGATDAPNGRICYSIPPDIKDLDAAIQEAIKRVRH